MGGADLRPLGCDLRFEASAVEPQQHLSRYDPRTGFGQEFSHQATVPRVDARLMLWHDLTGRSDGGDHRAEFDRDGLTRSRRLTGWSQHKLPHHRCEQRQADRDDETGAHLFHPPGRRDQLEVEPRQIRRLARLECAEFRLLKRNFERPDLQL